ncbi:hypothetical protein LAZ67_1002854 [Cordylochernes scorpioides]|uniref:Cathepsin propeptide inhibitor domain-containing protein n=1 Tax=Cordylochernes scorpioides TaxID=51811 RepID=A0ABY6JY21_9ARAC|nr:hypothetical protein LAZ67_1002854 [Cordylochernes scorpioides]
MKFLVALTLLALGSQCLVGPPTTTTTTGSASRYLQELHGKNYKGLEDQARKAIFEENLKKIVQHNLEYELGMHSYHLGINKYSDWKDQCTTISPHWCNLQGLQNINRDEESLKQALAAEGPISIGIDAG